VPPVCGDNAAIYSIAPPGRKLDSENADVRPYLEGSLKRITGCWL